MPTKIKHIVGKTRQKQVYLVGKKTHIPRPCPVKMQAEYPKYLLHFAPDPRKYLVQLLLFLRKGLASTFLVQNPTKCPLLAASLAYRLTIIGLIRKDGLLLSFKQVLKDLGIMHVGWCADKLCHKLRLWINGYVILVAIDGFSSLFGKRGIIILARPSCCFDQAGINDLSSFILSLTVNR